MKKRDNVALERIATQAIAFAEGVVWPYDDDDLRLVRSVEEFEAISALRSQVLREMGYDKLLPDPIDGYHFDAHDTRSAIFYTQKAGRITGTCRVVFDDGVTLPIDEQISVDFLRRDDRRIAELSRFVIDPTRRGSGREFRLLIKGMYGIVAYNALDRAVTAIRHEHYRYYADVGGFRIEAQLRSFGTIDHPFIVASWDTTQVSERFKRLFLR